VRAYPRSEKRFYLMVFCMVFNSMLVGTALTYYVMNEFHLRGPPYDVAHHKSPLNECPIFVDNNCFYTD
jgi:hypothetical protein